MYLRGITLNMVLNKVSTHCLFIMHDHKCQVQSMPHQGINLLCELYNGSLGVQMYLGKVNFSLAGRAHDSSR